MDKQIIVALDFPTLRDATRMSELLGDRFGYKVGMELNTAAGTPQVLDDTGAWRTFLDLKFHDIPNTVAGAVRAAARQGVWMLNVHCQGGLAMMQAAAQARDEVFKATGHRTLVIGVTMLTSLDDEAAEEMGIYREMSMKERVRRLAVHAYKAGLDGVVSSPQEIMVVRDAIPDEKFKIVTPGIRSKDAPPDDQKRTMEARQAIDIGASYLVIGRPITQAPDPLEAAEKFLEAIS